MKVLIVIPHSDFLPTLPLGPLSIATYLNCHNHIAEILDCMLGGNSIEKYFRKLPEDDFPGLVAVSLMSASGLHDAIEISGYARKAGIPVVWGGGFTVAYSDVIFNSGVCDFISVGDGEISITQLADALENKTGFSDISGLIYKKDGKTLRNTVRNLEEAELPELDLTLINPGDYTQPFFCTKKMVHLYMSRGCPFNCTFCNREIVGSKKYRRKNLDYVINEIKYLVNDCGCDGIYFYDELWCINREQAFEFCDRIESEKLKFSFGCFARIGQYDKAALKRLYDCGCRWILFGIESGSPAVREKVNKYLDDDKIIETFEDCHNLGIITQAAFMVGIPGETEEDLKKTVNLAFTIQADLLPFSNFTPVRGSVLYRELVDSGKLRDNADILSLQNTIFPSEKISENYSSVPTADLNVVRAFFRWCGFSNSGNNLSKFEIAKEIIAKYTKIIFSGKSLNISGIKDSVTVLTDVVFNVFLHPGIRKKYGLYKKNFKHG